MSATVDPSSQMKSASKCAEGQDAATDTGSSQADTAVDAPLEAGELIKPPPETISSTKAEHGSPVFEEGDPVTKKPSLQEQTNLLPTKQLLIVFFGCALSLMLSMLDQTIVANLIPTLARDFNAGRSVSWVATSYLLTSTAFQPIVGRLSDIFGRKRMMLVAIAFFWVGSLASSLAQNMPELIAFRSVQGIGGGAILSLVMIVMSDVVSLRERGKYQGILSIFVGARNVFHRQI
jgi:Na+/melibiose symporter-like transporter